ncbi:G2/mitotic-specific cyclin B, copy B-like protein [Daphnia pulex]|uniref:G2/mitotic-specific cyclin B, copy B-like protein n=1 Tax=Daphnia pulex TaxID=6669 RepID=E9HD88_DAPPU|nr:G2/mitotic-specific cyclin B, copy B-like protein [Daphnia pulex]|eukprot:EFX70326.1 G2/mitotic-specific cyclin B, copy B-like protein [Daphnia pulex]
MPRLRLDAAPSNMMLENRNNTLKAKSTTSGFVVQKAQGPSLRPRAILGDLTKATAVSVNQVKNEQPDEKIKKPAMGIAPRKPLQSTNVTKKVVPAAAPKAVVCTNKAEPEAYSSKQLPIEDIDLDRDNPQLVSYYAKDIYSYLRQLEKSFMIGAHYMDFGYIIRPTMRTILVDWLVDVHGRQILDQVDVLHHTLSKYLMELTLPEYSFCHYLPSELAAAALCLSLRILDENDTDGSKLWNHSMVYYSGYTYESLEPLMEKLCGLVASADVSKFQAVRKKYACSKLYNISTVPHLKSPLVTVLAKRSAAIKN